MTRTRAVESWAEQPLDAFVQEAGVRLALLMTPAGQVLAEHGFTRAMDVMAAAALGAAIVSSTSEIARLVEEPRFLTLNHQGVQHGIFLAGLDSPRGRLLVLAVYGPDSSMGLVQLFFEDLLRELVAACPTEEAPKKVLPADFEKELTESLTALFRK